VLYSSRMRSARCECCRRVRIGRNASSHAAARCTGRKLQSCAPLQEVGAQELQDEPRRPPREHRQGHRSKRGRRSRSPKRPTCQSGRSDAVCTRLPSLGRIRSRGASQAGYRQRIERDDGSERPPPVSTGAQGLAPQGLLRSHPADQEEPERVSVLGR